MMPAPAGDRRYRRRAMNGRLPAAPNSDDRARHHLRRRQPCHLRWRMRPLRRGRRVVLFALRGMGRPATGRGLSAPLDLDRPVRPLHRGSPRRKDAATWPSSARSVRPSLWQIRPDFRAHCGRCRNSCRCSGAATIICSQASGGMFEQHGFRLLGPQEIAPELADAARAARRPRAERTRPGRHRAGPCVARATSPFDIGQAVVVANNQVLAVEGPEGTDQMLARVAELRRNGRIRTPAGVGVLVKAAKIGQDHRIDLPAIGPPTVEGAAARRSCRHCRGRRLNDRGRAGADRRQRRPRQDFCHRRRRRWPQAMTMHGRAGPRVRRDRRFSWLPPRNPAIGLAPR